MKEHNANMKAFLFSHGIKARVKYIGKGSLRGTWRLYDPNTRWNENLINQLNGLGFVDFDSRPLGRYSGNGGMFSVFVRRQLT